MPVLRDEKLALADVYAESLIAVADEQGRTDTIAAEFADLIRYMDKNPEFATFLTADSIDDDARRESLEKMFRGKMDDLLLNLLQVLNRRRRLWLVRSIGRAGQLRMQERRDQQEVIVETAVPLTDDLRQSVKDQMSRQIGREALLIERVNPELIGGIVIRVGDMQIDASVASRIAALRRKLSDRATLEIHSHTDRLIEA